MHTPQTPQRGRARRLLVALLTLFLLTQTLGWMHRSLHGPERGTRLAQVLPGAQAATSAQVGPAAAAPHSSGWLDALFGTHDAPSKCTLFDAVLHPGCTPATALVAGPAPVALAPAAPQEDAGASPSTHYEARGPPVFRA